MRRRRGGNRRSRKKGGCPRHGGRRRRARGPFGVGGWVGWVVCGCVRHPSLCLFLHKQHSPLFSIPPFPPPTPVFLPTYPPTHHPPTLAFPSVSKACTNAAIITPFSFSFSSSSSSSSSSCC